MDGAIVGGGKGLRLGTILGIAFVIIVIIGLTLMFVWNPFSRDDEPQTKEQITSPARPAPRSAIVQPGPAQPALPPPLPTVHPDVQRIIGIMEQRRPAHDGGGIEIDLRGASGALYRLYYDGRARSPEKRTLMIGNLPTHADAHDGNSRVSLDAMTVWDRGLIGGISKGCNGSPYAMMDEGDRTCYQRAISGVQRGRGANRWRPFQDRYKAMRDDIIAGATRR